MKDINKEASKGDILVEENSAENHFLVYLEPHPENEDSFIAALLTHSLLNANIPLQKDHFIIADENELKYRISFDRSLVANHPVYKKMDGASFQKVGQLTPKGITFIEDHIAPYVKQFIPKNLG